MKNSSPQPDPTAGTRKESTAAAAASAPTPTASYSTLQLSGIVLRLRDDLSFSMREYHGETTCVVEDELRSKFYRIGLAEYTFVSLLNGRRSFSEALGLTASILKDQAFSETDAASLCRWLVETGLASTPASRSSVRLFETTRRTQNSQRQQRANLMFVKIPLCRPDNLMKASASLLGWIFSPIAILIWCALVAAAILNVASQQAAGATLATNIVSQFNWLSFVLSSLGLKLIHEMAHGTACRRFGCSVREAGVMTILFVPLPYVDVTSAWRLDSRWQRIMISAAGMYAELFVAAVAAFVWASAEPGLTRQIAFNVMFSASVVSLLFNANPLMKFDGYHILTDYLEQPNLATHGQLCLKSLGRQLFFGLSGHATDWPEGRTWLVVLYGVGAFVWRMTICVGMILAADAMFFGAGAILAAVAVFAWVVVPTVRLVVFAVRGSQTEQPNRRRMIFAGLAVVTAVVFVAGLRFHERIEAPAVVDFDPVVHVRTAVAGFVTDVQVENGVQVAEGTLLLQLDNPELTIQRQQLADQLAQAQQRGRLFHHRGEIAAWQVEQSTEDSLRQQLRQLNQRLEQLRLRAPVDGVVVDGDLRSLVGTYVTAGTQVLSMGPTDSRTVLSVVPEHLADAFRTRASQSVEVHIQGTGDRKIFGQLGVPEPQGSTQLPHPAFAATAGGSVDVQIQNADEDPSKSPVAFTRPHFLTRVAVSPSDLSGLQAGRTGFVFFEASRGTVGEVATDAAIRWWTRRQTALRTSTALR